MVTTVPDELNASIFRVFSKMAPKLLTSLKVAWGHSPEEHNLKKEKCFMYRMS
jgi:hypothetical protein